jgi:hypothetical protein
MAKESSCRALKPIIPQAPYQKELRLRKNAPLLVSVPLLSSP